MNVASELVLAGAPEVDYAIEIIDGPEHSGRGEILPDGRYLSPSNPGVVTLRISADGGSSRDVVVSVGSSRAWILGGNDTYGGFNLNVHSSSSGSGWADEGVLGWTRSDAATVVYHDALWLLGGHDGVSTVDTVLRSEDGVSWDVAGQLPEPLERTNAVVFGNRIWIAGGIQENGGRASAVWSSADGTSWRSEPPLPSSRGSAVMLVFAETLWFLGGYDDVHNGNSNVWRLEGAGWTDLGDLLPLAMKHGIGTVYADSMWVAAGLDGLNAPRDDAHTSTDGLTWTSAAALPDVRVGASATVVADELLVVGGGRDYFWQPPCANAWRRAADDLSWLEAELPLPVVGASSAAFTPRVPKVW